VEGDTRVKLNRTFFTLPRTTEPIGLSVLIDHRRYRLWALLYLAAVFVLGSVGLWLFNARFG